MAKPKQFPPPTEQPFLQHLIELRDRLLRVVAVVMVVFLALFAFANDIYSYLADPLMRHLPEGASMIATEVASPFLTPFKLTLVLSVFIAVPVILYQLWGFIAPGLYRNERRLIFPLMFSSTLLFFAGMAFAYYVVFPLVFGFLIGIAPEGVAVMTDISRYLDFVLKMFFAFGIAFEVPIATILVVWSGMTTAAELAKKRPYIIVGAFVFGMLLTPPDVISQTLLALPMWILFEVGLVMSRWYAKPEEGEDTDPTQETPPDGPAPGDGGSAGNSPDGAATAATTAARTTASTDSATDAGVTDTADTETVNESGHAEYEPLSESEMDAELDRIEADEAPQDDDEPVLQPTASERKGGDFRVGDGVDEAAHAKATEEALAIARAARGEIPTGVDTEPTATSEQEKSAVYTEDDHQRATEEAMAIARAAAGVAGDHAGEENGNDGASTRDDNASDQATPSAEKNSDIKK